MTLTLSQTIDVLVLLAAANGGPVFAARLLGDRWSWPLDGGITAWDGRALLGSSKTVRGLVVAVALTTLAAVLLGMGWRLGVAFGLASMAGDLCSSFAKRRLGVLPSGQALGLDQIPEALFPLLVCRQALGLDLVGVAVLVVAFTAAELVVSPLMYALGIRRRPY